MSGAASLERVLAAAGVDCAVEARERLAVLVPRAGGVAAFADPALRERALRLATEHGFTHLAVELPRADRRSDALGADAAVPRA